MTTKVGDPANAGVVAPRTWFWRGPRNARVTWAARSRWLEIATIVAGYGVYELIQGLAPAGRGPAFAHAHQLARLERVLHLNVELSVNHVLNAHAILATAAGYYYDGLHYLITPGVLIWLWLCHRDVYGRWRSILIIASLSALVVFWAWAVAPPRLASPGIIDTLVTRHVYGTVESPSTSKVVNDFAAMPSLHVGWAVWCAAAVSSVSRHRLRYLAWLYPAATTFVVLGTGNHYVLDAIGGILVVTAAWLLTRPHPLAPQPPATPARTALAVKHAEREVAACERQPAALVKYQASVASPSGTGPRARRAWLLGPLIGLCALVAGGGAAFGATAAPPTVRPRSRALFDAAPPPLQWAPYGEAAVGAQGMGVLATHGSHDGLPTASVAKLLTALAVVAATPVGGQSRGTAAHDRSGRRNQL